MKTISKMIRMSVILTVWWLSSSTSVQAQRLMAVNDNLLNNGTAYPVTWKGISTFPKFQFHTYGVISGKTGWTKSRYNSKLFSRLETASSKYNGSFLIASQAGDSAVVNFSRNLDYRGLGSQGLVIEGPRGALTLGSAAETLESNDNYVALIETSPNETVWRLVITQNFDSEVGSNFFGWMTDGERRIDIKTVFDYQEPGKKGMVDLMMGGEHWHKGFEFFEDARALGAVQLGPNKKQFLVWLSKDIDPFTEFLVATASIALLKDYMVTMD